MNESNDEVSANLPKDAGRNMVVSYRQERATELRRRKYLLGVFLIVLALVLGRDWMFGFLKKSALFVAEPMWQAASVGVSATSDIAGSMKGKDEVLAENAKLKKTLDDLSLTIKTDSALRIENAQLRALGGRGADGSRILARILTRPPKSVYDTFIIDAGGAEGVGVGMRAVIAGDFLVGTVTNVALHSSVLELSSTAGVAYDAMLAGKIDDATTSAPEFLDNASTTLASATDNTGVASTTSSTATIFLNTSTSTPIATTTTNKKGKGKNKEDAKTADIIAKRSSVTFVGEGGGGFRALVPKQVPVVRDEPIALDTTIPSFLGIVTGIYVPPSGSLKEVYGSLPIGIGQIEFVSLVPALPLPPTLPTLTGSTTKK